MYDFLAVCEQDCELVDYLKFALNQKATLAKKTWHEVFTDFTVEASMLSNKECYEYFDQYPLIFLSFSRNISVQASETDSEYISKLVKIGILTSIQKIAFENGYYD